MYFSPYSYLKDNHQNIFVLRGGFKNSDYVLAKLIYQNFNGKYLKCKSKLKTPITNFSLTRANFSDITDFLLPKRSISLLKTISLEETQIKQNEYLWYFYDKLSSLGAKLTLFGSRALGINGDNADWDFLVEWSGHPRTLIEKITSSQEYPFRYFNENEILKRYFRYADSCPNASPNFLLKLFNSSTVYLKCNDIEIGIFINSNINLPIPSLNDYRHELTNIEGKIIDSNGSSFYMPRIIRIESNKTVYQIIHTSWPLCGIESLSGNQIKFSNLIKISESTFWLCPQIAKIDFEEQ